MICQLWNSVHDIFLGSEYCKGHLNELIQPSFIAPRIFICSFRAFLTVLQGSISLQPSCGTCLRQESEFSRLESSLKQGVSAQNIKLWNKISVAQHEQSSYKQLLVFVRVCVIILESQVLDFGFRICYAQPTSWFFESLEGLWSQFLTALLDEFHNNWFQQTYMAENRGNYSHCC